MDDMRNVLIRFIDELIWDDKYNDMGKVKAIQNLMYQYEAISDARSMEIEDVNSRPQQYQADVIRGAS